MKISTRAYGQDKIAKSDFILTEKNETHISIQIELLTYFEKRNKHINKLWAMFHRLLKPSIIKGVANKVNLVYNRNVISH